MSLLKFLLCHVSILLTEGNSDEEGCGRPNCNCSSIIKAALEPSMEMELPYLDVEGLSSEQEQSKRELLIREHKEILFAFQNLISTAMKVLKRNNHTPKSVVEYVEGLEAFYRARDSKEQAVPLFKHLLPQLREVTRIEQVFAIIREHHSFYNHHLVIDMIHNMGVIQIGRRLRKEHNFLDKFNFYARRKLTECPRLYALPSLRGYCTMEILVNIDPADTILHEIESVRLRLGIQLKLARNSLRLIYAEKSGVRRTIYTFQFPAFLHSLVFPLNEEQKTALQKEKIVYLDCCGYRFSIEVSC